MGTVSPTCSCPDDGENTIFVLLGNGNGTFSPSSAISTTTYDVSNLIISDLEGDGSPDIILMPAKYGHGNLTGPPQSAAFRHQHNYRKRAAAIHFTLLLLAQLHRDKSR